MAVNRDYILDMLKSRTTTIDRFNYDKLSCPPILSMFTYQDINNLHNIASSLRYSAKPKVKFDEIDKIMRSRGFVKLVAGTNRICYRCIEDTSFVVKVAYNDVGLKDNPAEFRNQFNLKPFCTKVFECGDFSGVVAPLFGVNDDKAFTAKDDYNITVNVLRQIVAGYDDYIRQAIDLINNTCEEYMKLWSDIMDGFHGKRVATNYLKQNIDRRLTKI